MTSRMSFVCYNMHNREHVTITVVREDFSYMPLLHSWASHFCFSWGWKKSAEWAPAECCLLSRAASLLFKPADCRCSLQGSWGPVLVCKAGGLCPSLFKVPPGFCKGHEGLTCLLQASECHSGKEIVWGDARKQHSREQVEPPYFTGSLGKKGKPAPSQGVAPRLHWQNKAHSCAQAAFLCGSRMDNEILFFNLAVGEGTRKLLMCTGNEPVYILSQAFYYVFLNQQKYNRTASHCVPSDFNIHI